jgi:hypothetical protein
MMKRYLYGMSVVATIAAAGIVQAQFAGSDDFNNNTLSPTKWNRLVEEESTMLASGQRLLYTTIGKPSAANCITSWKNTANATSNWVAQVDVRVPFLPLLCQQRIEVGLVVVKGRENGPPQTDDPVLDIYQRVEPNKYPTDSCQDIWREGRTVWSSASRIGMDSRDQDHAQVSLASTLVSLRLRWDAAEGVLMAEYDPNGPIDGFQWTILSCRHLADYGWGQIDRFLVNLYAYSENCQLTEAEGVGLDNFRASYLTPVPPAVTLAAPKVSGSAVSMSFQSEPSSSYTLEAKDNVTQPDWHPIESVLGNGSKLTLTDRDHSSPLRFYRLRTP